MARSIVDQTTPNDGNPTVPAYVFGTYFSISPYRYDPSETNTFFGNEPIDGGINLNDRSEFYVPWTQNRGNANQMFLGTYRLYRTEQRRGADGWRRHLGADQPGPHHRLRGRGPERRAWLPDLRDRRRRRR